MAMTTCTVPMQMLMLLVLLSSAVAIVTDANVLLVKKTKTTSPPASVVMVASPAPAPIVVPAVGLKDDEEGSTNKTKTMISPTNGVGWYKGMTREFVNGHNKVRERYGVLPMRWDTKLARHARRWANAMRKDCEIRHSTSNYGESVFVGRNAWNATAKDAIEMWSTEEPIYDRRTGNCSDGHLYSECGHFALMVDKDNRRIGCARAECFNKIGVFISCNYYVLNHD